MDNTERQRIYTRLSAKGLIGDVIERVRMERPKASRNTVYLAFQAGATTPTREMILDIAAKLLEEVESNTTEQVAA